MANGYDLEFRTESQQPAEQSEPGGFVKALIFINEFNPVANAWDAVSGYVNGTDRFGKPITKGDATWEAASVIPLGRVVGVAKGLAVIGPRAAYRQFAQGIGAKFLNVTDDAWTWAKNEKFLAGIVKRGDDVVFAGKFDLNQLNKTSVLAKEINYLESHGYQWTDGITRMILK